VSGAAPMQGDLTALVRRATELDVPGVGVAVEELLLELGGKPSSTQELGEATRALLADGSQGLLLVAESEQSEIVGFLGVSWQTAVRIPGRYGLIQELWVHPRWRSREIGAQLLAALGEEARREGVRRIEVGLPGEQFASLPATEAFYRANGFAPVGLRMKLLLGEDEPTGSKGKKKIRGEPKGDDEA
jgi:GNAT superfamily N-acetyltransferase